MAKHYCPSIIDYQFDSCLLLSDVRFELPYKTMHIFLHKWRKSKTYTYYIQANPSHSCKMICSLQTFICITRSCNNKSISYMLQKNYILCNLVIIRMQETTYHARYTDDKPRFYDIAIILLCLEEFSRQMP